MSEMMAKPEAYFRRMLPKRSALLHALEEEARREEIPIVGPVVGELLYVLARATGAARILELGTATGYSAIFLAEACAATGGHLTAMEVDETMARRAAANLASAGLTQWAEVKCVNALEEMARIVEPLDFIFMDIEKEDYLTMLPHCARVLRTGGFLLADNVGFADADAFNRAIVKDPAWRTVSLFAFLPEHSPEKDGLCLAVRV
ncbi:MAG: methyltransferase domain-containing protein [Desulfobacteraceae bacterium]|nr:methyltransferase domain-containing protein [Desulfobacteraceae bacterium]MBC2750532.1 class I SAM-dependent methyltransferase [Desulfobacteraceae bacterium]